MTDAFHLRAVSVAGGTPGQTPVINAAGDALEYADPPAGTGGTGGGTTVTDWTALPLASGYSSNDASFGLVPAYRLVGDVVELRGVLKKTAGGNFTTGAAVLFATLPVGFRPPNVGTVPVVYGNSLGSSNVTVRFEIKPDGTLTYFTSGSTSWITLDDISFSISTTSASGYSGGGGTGTGGDVDAHLADTVDAHDASAISVTPAGGITETDVQAALEGLDTRIGTTPTTTAGIVTVDDLPTSGIWSAHHGAGAEPYLIPDGSLSAYRVATAMGAHILDADIQTTADGVPILMHDTTVDRTTSGTGNVSAFPSHQLPPIDMGNVSGEGWTPEPVPTAEELLRLYGGKVILTIQARSTSDVPLLAGLIQKYGLEQSVFINTNDTTIAAAITAAGCLLHFYGCTTASAVDAADDAGAWLIEVPYNADSSVQAAVAAAVNIQRVIAAPIWKRSQVAALPAWINGYVNDALGYANRASDAASLSSIAASVSTSKIGFGWREAVSTGWASTDRMFRADGGLIQSSGTKVRNTRFGDLCGAKPTSYTIKARFKFFTSSAQTLRRCGFRVCVPSEQGTGADADTQGYVFGIRANGQLVVWSSNTTLGGAAASLAAVSTTALTDGTQYELQFIVTPTTIELKRTDTGATTGAIANTTWRGPDVWSMGNGSASVGDCAVTGFDIV